MKNLPGVMLCATVWAYWLGVGVMVVRVHRKTRSLRLGGLVPKQPLERLLWIVWVPLVASWLVLPYLALVRRGVWIRTPEWAIEDPAYAGLPRALPSSASCSRRGAGHAWTPTGAWP